MEVQYTAYVGQYAICAVLGKNTEINSVGSGVMHFDMLVCVCERVCECERARYKKIYQSRKRVLRKERDVTL